MLPLAEEIREMRASVDEAYAAVQLVAQLPMIRFELEQLAIAGQGTDALPGEDVVREATARWPIVVGSLPGLDLPPVDRILARAAQLREVEASLQPLADDYVERNAVLGGLIHDQYHLLEDPMFGEVIERLAQLDARRDALLAEVGPLQARQTGLMPLIAGLEAMVSPILASLELDVADVWGECLRSASLGLASIAAAVDVPLALPETTGDVRADLVALYDWIVATHAALRAESVATTHRMGALAAQYAAITEQMQEETG
jgi:hypothetical protein